MDQAPPTKEMTTQMVSDDDRNDDDEFRGPRMEVMPVEYLLSLMQSAFIAAQLWRMRLEEFDQTERDLSDSGACLFMDAREMDYIQRCIERADIADPRRESIERFLSKIMEGFPVEDARAVTMPTPYHPQVPDGI